MFPKTAVISGTGRIGKVLLSLYKEIYPDSVGTARDRTVPDLKYLDLLSCDIGPLGLSKAGYKNAVITAGISRLNVCEVEKDYARRMTEGTMDLIQQLVREGIKPIYISSDYVFDGRTGNYDDNAPTNPLNEYGKQKAEIEKRIKEICNGNYMIARFSKVFTLERGDGTIFDEMASTLISGGTLQAAFDQIFSPTLLLDAVNAVKALQAKDVTGIVNICSPEVWSRYDLALNMADHLGIDPVKVKKVSLDDLNENFKRPKNTSMATERLKKETQSKFMPISQCIKKISDNWKSMGYKVGK
jgi:dTDP-4-dehydrorhamnose reductase